MILHHDVPHGTPNYPFAVHETYCNSGLSLYPHVHPEFELTVITEGNGTFYIDSEEYIVKKGDCILIAPNKIHLADSVDLSNKASYFSIVFHPDCFGAGRNTLIYSKYVQPFIQGKLRAIPLMNGTEPWHSSIYKLAQNIKTLYFQGDSELLCQSSMLELWFHIFNHAETLIVPEINRANFMLKDTIEYMQTNYNEHITVASLANRVGLSQSYFSRLYNQYMHTSPIDYLIKIRLQKSTELLLNSTISVSEIALKCGFNDFSYFSKCFRQRYGCSPREYMKKNTTQKT